MELTGESLPVASTKLGGTLETDEQCFLLGVTGAKDWETLTNKDRFSSVVDLVEDDLVVELVRVVLGDSTSFSVSPG